MLSVFRVKVHGWYLGEGEEDGDEGMYYGDEQTVLSENGADDAVAAARASLPDTLPGSDDDASEDEQFGPSKLVRAELVSVYHICDIALDATDCARTDRDD